MSGARQLWDRKRAEAYAIGVRLRERLLAEYMVQNRLTERPLLKDVVEDLLSTRRASSSA
jgi:hypothetical protein